MDEYNDLLLVYRATKIFAREAVELGLQQSALLLTERESSLRQALEKLDKKKA